jgi:hypothetical protein
MMRALTGEDQAFFAAPERNSFLPAEWTTALLSRCMPDHESPANLTVGEREALLLRLRQISYGDRMDCVLDCPSQGCGEKLDLQLRVSDLLMIRPANNPAEHLIGGVRFRLPTGADQEAAAALALSDVEAAVELLLQRCVLASAGPISPELCESLSELMAELDPQAEMQIDVHCPACGTVFRTLFDAASFLMQEMKGGIRNLYREVHTLAWHYHWSASEILGLPVTERRRYLQLIEEQLGEGGLQ